MNTKVNINNGFYTDEKFGKVPIGWEVWKIRDCFDFFPTSSYSRSKLSESGECGYVHYGDIHTKFHIVIDLDKDKLPFVTTEMSEKYTKVKEGDIIIADASEDYDGVGKAIEIKNLKEKKVIAGLHTLHLRQKDDLFINGIIGYILNAAKVRNNILRISTGIKVYGINKTGLSKVLIPKPPEPEQTAIATILSKVDEAIQATQNTIKAAEKLKKALMQNLLTGKLKPDGAWRTEEEFYLDEKFGKVPIGWTYGTLRDIAEIIAGQSPTGDTYNNEGKGMAMLNGPTEFTEYFPIAVQYTTKPTKICEKGDILFTVRGSSTGRMNFADREYCIGRGLAAIRALKNANINFLYSSLVRISNIILAEAKGAGSTFPNVSRGELRKKKIIYPNTKNEQDQIGKILKSTDEKIKSKKSKIKTLQRLKKSLMQNLLTGKIRVDVAKVNEIISQTQA